MSTKGLTFKNIHSSSLGLAMKSESRPILASRADTYVDIPNRDGSILIPGSMGDIFISIKFAIKASSLEDLRTKAKQVGSWLDSTTREQLKFDDEPNQYWMGKVINQIDIAEAALLGEFTVTFRCLPDPIEVQP